MQALFVEAAFARDDEVSGGDAGFESDLRRDHIEAAHETSAEESHETEAESTRRAGTRHVARIHAEVASREVGEMFESLFEPGEVADTFLRTVDARGAAGAEQGVVDVTGDDQLKGGQGGRFLEPVGLQHRLERGGERLAGFFESIS